MYVYVSKPINNDVTSLENSFDIPKELEVLCVEEVWVDEEFDNLAKGVDSIIAQALVASAMS